MMFSADPHPLARGGSVALCCVSLMHVTQAFMLLFWAEAGNATPLRALLYVFWGMGLVVGWATPALLATASLALIGTLFRLGRVRLLLFVPQHFFLGIMALGGLYAAWRGVYLDGTVIAGSHILVDQMPVTVLFLVHSSAILRRAKDPNG